MHRTRILVLPILLLLAASGFAREEGSFDRTLKVTGPVELEVTTGSGDITVRTGPAGTVSVHAILRAGQDWSGWFGSSSAAERIKAIQANPPIEQNGNSIRIGRFRDEHMDRNVSISYELITPADTRLRSRTGSGGQTVTGLRGPADVGTGSGNIRITDIASDVRASSGSGGIEANNIAGSLRARTGSGSITGGHIGSGSSVETRAKYQGKELPLVPSSASSGTSGADLDFETGSGSIRLDNLRGALRARAGSGRIELDGQPSGDWNVSTGSGGITVRLPAQTAFNIYARTTSGSITVDHPVTSQGTMTRHEVRGTVRGGGFHLDIHTGSGSIHVE